MCRNDVCARSSHSNDLISSYEHSNVPRDFAERSGSFKTDGKRKVQVIRRYIVWAALALAWVGLGGLRTTVHEMERPVPLQTVYLGHFHRVTILFKFSPSGSSGLTGLGTEGILTLRVLRGLRPCTPVYLVAMESVTLVHFRPFVFSAMGFLVAVGDWGTTKCRSGREVRGVILRAKGESRIGELAARCRLG